MGKHACFGGRLLRFEPLERRELLAVLTVNSLLDNTTSGDGLVTLREAIAAANTNTATDLGQAGSGADTIEFVASLSGAVNLSIIGDTAAGPSALVITSPITIRGNTNGITLQRSESGPEMRLFRVAADVGSLTLETITLTGGLARGADGAQPGADGEAGRGGAILNQGKLEIVGSTLHANQAIGGNAVQAAGGRGLGGAIANDGGHSTIKNSTISTNAVGSGTGNGTTVSFGGGIYTLNGTLNVYNSTITANAANSGRGIYVFSEAGTATVVVESSIVGQQDVAALAPDFAALAEPDGALVISGGNNLIRRHLNFSGTVVSTADPMLTPLAHNGGPTLTHGLQADSPAIDNGSNLLGLATDQRGGAFARTVGVATDIGAFEAAADETAVRGDYNGDLSVDAADYVVWRKTFGSTVGIYMGADGSGNSIVDAEDYEVWSADFGETTGGGTAASGPVEYAVVVSRESGEASKDEAHAAMMTIERPVLADASVRQNKNGSPPTLERRRWRSLHRDAALLAALAETDAVARTELEFSITILRESESHDKRQLHLLADQIAVAELFEMGDGWCMFEGG